MYPIDEVRLSNMTSTSPPSMPESAGPLPLYGTCTILTPVIIMNISADMWIDVPLPEDAKLILPGLLFARAMNSATDFAGTEGLTSMTFGTRAIMATGTRSFSRS
jgi:hypothetical protein